MNPAEREGYRKGLLRAAEIVEASGKPGPGGVNMTNGIPSEIFIGIGRGRYEDESGEYDLAEDTAASVRRSLAEWMKQEASAVSA